MGLGPNAVAPDVHNLRPKRPLSISALAISLPRNSRFSARPLMGHLRRINLVRAESAFRLIVDCGRAEGALS
jgi:hypothetical protein